MALAAFAARPRVQIRGKRFRQPVAPHQEAQRDTGGGSDPEADDVDQAGVVHLLLRGHPRVLGAGVAGVWDPRLPFGLLGDVVLAVGRPRPA